MKGWITINTDAGFYQWDKVGSFAYWIKGDNLHLHGSGMLKGEVISSTQAEMMAIANALHVLKCSQASGIIKIIINRDNIHAISKKKGGPVGKTIYALLRHFWDEGGFRHTPFSKFYEFRHVKAHSGTDEPRKWVNDWLDKQCKMRLTEWRLANKIPHSSKPADPI